MTGIEIFKTACAFLATQMEDNTELEPIALAWLNSLLAEALPYENAHRTERKLPLLAGAPLLTGFAEVIPYCEDIMRIALPFGLAAYLFMEDESFGMAAEFRNRYLSALYEAAPLTAQKTLDVYGGEV